MNSNENGKKMSTTTCEIRTRLEIFNIYGILSTFIVNINILVNIFSMFIFQTDSYKYFRLVPIITFQKIEC